MLGIALVLLWVLTWTPPVHAECVVDTDSPTFVDGKRIDLRCNASGELITSGGVGGGGDASLAEQQTQTGLLTIIDSDTGTIAGAVKAEDAAHSSGHTGIPFWGVRNDAGASALSDTNGDYTPVAVDSTGKLFISTLNTISGAVVPGTSAAHLGKAEDAAHTTGDTGVMMLGVRSASPTDRSAGPTDGDYEPPGINDVGAMWTTPTGSANGGAATSYTASTASTNATQVKASPGTVYSIVAVNTTATIYYLRLYNLAAAPTCSSATGFVATIPVPASASGAGIQIPLLVGQAYSTGIGFCLTGGAGSTDNTNAATGVYVTIIYK